MLENVEKNKWIIEENPPSYPKVIGYFKSKCEINQHGVHLGYEKASKNAKIIKEALNINLQTGKTPSEIYENNRILQKELEDMKYKLIKMQLEISDLEKKKH